MNQSSVTRLAKIRSQHDSMRKKKENPGLMVWSHPYHDIVRESY